MVDKKSTPSAYVDHQITYNSNLSNVGMGNRLSSHMANLE
jgi:hypothetical protein